MLTLDRNKSLSDFENAPDKTLFNQVTIAHIRDCSITTLQRDRWLGVGIPYLKIGRAVKYRKSDVLNWLDQYQAQLSTSEFKRS